MSFLQNLSNSAMVKIFYSPIPGISRALIHSENLSVVGHYYSNQLEFLGNVLLPLPVFNLKLI
jgi:hypothetical protein